MTNFTTRMMIAAATLVVAAGSASAQEMKADIPFAFRAGGVVLAAGTYQVSVSSKSGQPVFKIWSAQESRSILVLANTSRDPQKDWVASGKPVMSFECGVSHCALSGVWEGSTSPAYGFPRPKLGRDEPTHTALVVMRPSQGD